MFRNVVVFYMIFFNGMSSAIITGNISQQDNYLYPDDPPSNNNNNRRPTPYTYRKFPDGFLFGAATAAYQVEGAWNTDGKGPSIWDRFTHEKPDRVHNNENGDVACDSYHKYKEDIRLAAKMGMHHYRFSVSWPRILPTGYENIVNHKGIAYYQSLVEECLRHGIMPVATIYHWDMPVAIQDLGGFMNPDVVPLFVNYARIVIQSLPGVGVWNTMNEPKLICTRGYGEGAFAPGIENSGYGEYRCAYVLLLAHAAIYRMYKKEFPHYKANMSIVIDGEWNEPASKKIEDIEAAERRNQFEFGLYANPIYNGDWPKVVIDRIGERSAIENLLSSRLPRFTRKQIEFIKGTWDFLGFNTYWTHKVTNGVEQSPDSLPSYVTDIRCNLVDDATWKEASPCGFNIVPWGARKMLKWVKDTYNNPPVFITENGVCDNGTSLNDFGRIQFYQDYLSEILKAIYDDGVNVYAYTAWALIDNFEWIQGYSAHYGFYHIDFEDPERKRVPKKSVKYYKDICLKGELPRRENLKSYLN
uniref:beta-glucosidase n=1 Tax=Chrysomela lapponica TaxID=153811 RepID=A0A0B5EDK4_CHRLA|nr:putative glycosyl hydrolase [Chrysomela lapponica]